MNPIIVFGAVNAMIKNIFVEDELKGLSQIDEITKFFPGAAVQFIARYDQYWGQFKKPYLHKRDQLNLYLAKKRGQLVKEAPAAYGLSGEPHYYFIHAYNCIYECQYCYLQGYFNTPDLVLFLNHDDIIKQMQETLQSHSDTVWFHAGEFSDSLALSHITKELPRYFEFFAQNRRAKLELRTKSSNIKELLKLDPLPNVFTSFSLSPADMAKRIDLKTPTLKARLKAMQQLVRAGHPIAVHLDPIIYSDDLEKEYVELFEAFKEYELIDAIAYISLGVVRFTKAVHREVERNYPDSYLHTQPMVTSFDNKVRYEHALRHWMLGTVKNIALNVGIAEEKLYLCMEDEA